MSTPDPNDVVADLLATFPPRSPVCDVVAWLRTREMIASDEEYVLDDGVFRERRWGGFRRVEVGVTGDLVVDLALIFPGAGKGQAVTMRRLGQRDGAVRTRGELRLGCWAVSSRSSDGDLWILVAECFDAASLTRAATEFVREGGTLEWARRHRFAGPESALTKAGEVEWCAAEHAAITVGPTRISRVRLQVPAALFGDEQSRFDATVRAFDPIGPRQTGMMEVGWADRGRWVVLGWARGSSATWFVEFVDTSEGGTTTLEPSAPAVLDALTRTGADLTADEIHRLVERLTSVSDSRPAAVFAPLADVGILDTEAATLTADERREVSSQRLERPQLRPEGGIVRVEQERGVTQAVSVVSVVLARGDETEMRRLMIQVIRVLSPAYAKVRPHTWRANGRIVAVEVKSGRLVATVTNW